MIKHALFGAAAFQTTGKPQTLLVTPARPKMKASRDDLSYIMVTIADDQRHPVPDAVVPVAFAVSGVGENTAVGNANPKDIASFRHLRRNSFQGTRLVVT
jgi:beta-galactosidase